MTLAFSGRLKRWRRRCCPRRGLDLRRRTDRLDGCCCRCCSRRRWRGDRRDSGLLMQAEVAHQGLTVEVVPSMHHRKARMIELADAMSHLDNAVKHGFISPEHRDLAMVDGDPDRLLTTRLLNDGHDISLGVRDPDRLRQDHPDLSMPDRTGCFSIPMTLASRRPRLSGWPPQRTGVMSSRLRFIARAFFVARACCFQRARPISMISGG